MPVLSITRLRLRSIWYLPIFLWHSRRTLKRAEKADGIVKARALADKRLTFWTVSLWTEQEKMRRYMSTGAHKKVMPSMQVWCNEGITATVDYPTETLPDAETLHRIVQTSGRSSKLRHPSNDHLNRVIAPPVFYFYDRS